MYTASAIPILLSPLTSAAFAPFVGLPATVWRALTASKRFIEPSLFTSPAMVLTVVGMMRISSRVNVDIPWSLLLKKLTRFIVEGGPRSSRETLISVQGLDTNKFCRLGIANGNTEKNDQSQCEIETAEDWRVFQAIIFYVLILTWSRWAYTIYHPW